MFVSAEYLVVSTSNPLVNNINNRLALKESSSSNSDKSHHSHASVHDLSLLGKSKLHSGHNSIRLSSLGLLVHLSLVRIQKKRIRERQRADGSQKTNKEAMHVSDQDDSTLMGDGALSRDGSEGSPLTEVKGNISIRDESVSLSVCGGADEYPSEHSMTSIPLLSLDGRSPSPLCEIGVFSLPVSSSLVEGVEDIEGSLTMVGR